MEIAEVEKDAARVDHVNTEEAALKYSELQLLAAAKHPKLQQEADASDLTITAGRDSIGQASDYDFFKDLQWSPDGTTLVLSSGTSNNLTIYVLPPDLLTPSSGRHHTLAPYRTHDLPEPTYATTIHPAFSLSNLESYYLTSLRNLPVRLLSPFGPGVVASYPLVNAHTEAWVTPHSLLFSKHEPTTFFAGSEGLVSLFDTWRDGNGPYASIRLGKRRRGGKAKLTHAFPGGDGRSSGVKGIVNALVENHDGVLVAGTFNGELALLDPFRQERLTGTLPLPKDAGRGVTALKFQPQPARGDYLVVASRCSDSLHVFDLRNPTAVMATLRGRKASTQQRLGIDVTANGEVWAGGTDGIVRIWDGVGMVEGEMEPMRELDLHNDAVAGIGLYPGNEAKLFATCAGSRNLDDGTDIGERRQRNSPQATESVDDDSQQSSMTNETLKVWTF